MLKRPSLVQFLQQCKHQLRDIYTGDNQILIEVYAQARKQ